MERRTAKNRLRLQGRSKLSAAVFEGSERSVKKMTAWETKFSLAELTAWRDSTTDPELKTRINKMINCLGLCVNNKILVTVERT